MSDNYDLSKKDSFRYITRFSEEYPQKLQLIKNPPSGIYVKGKLPDENKPSVAIVGSRICSQYGRLCAQEFGEVLAKNNIQIISGLARGIDGISQNACADAGGQSFGILGCGINVIYPAQNKPIYEKILENDGGIISEYAPDSPPIGAQFAHRNRIISALADIVLVVEAKKKSGTHITVSRAIEQGKDVYAIPGRINDICSLGCNELIALGAGIAYSPSVILDALNIKTPQDNHPVCQANNIADPIEKRVYSKLDYYPKNISEISKETHIPIPELSNILFHLMMEKYVVEQGKNNYIRLI